MDTNPQELVPDAGTVHVQGPTPEVLAGDGPPPTTAPARSRRRRHAKHRPANDPNSTLPSSPSPDTAPKPRSTQPPQPELPLIRYPPFPEAPPGTTIIPFKDFKERGIQIFATDPVTGVEVDGLGIPTVALKVLHETDECKTETRRKKVNKHGIPNITSSTPAPPPKAAPSQPATSKNSSSTQNPGEGNNGSTTGSSNVPRPFPFARKEWYDVWDEGEDLRNGTKSYNPQLTALDRMHIAASDFRMGRPWPPQRVQLAYLWDQFRLFAGLLSSMPIWTRTDLQQQEDEGNNDVEDDEAAFEADLLVEGIQAPWNQRIPAADTRNTTSTSRSTKSQGGDNADGSHGSGAGERPPPRELTRRKKAPARTPYALFNKDPIPVSSNDEVELILARATAQKDARLIHFLSDIEGGIKVFLSWWIRNEGLIMVPRYLSMLPRLVKFFLAFLLRAQVLPEYERDLKRAITVLDIAAIELPNTVALCKALPDAMGQGCKSCWDEVIPPYDYFSNFVWDTGSPGEGKERLEGGHDADAEVPEAEVEEIFEAELEAGNLTMLRRSPSPSLSIPGESESRLEEVLENDDDDPNLISVASPHRDKDAGISIEVVSPTSPGYADTIPPAIAGLDQDPARDVSMPPTNSPQPDPPLRSPPPTAVEAVVQDDGDDVWAFDSPADKQAALEARKTAWAPPKTQPLLSLFGMTNFPLVFEQSGRAVRGMRRVVEVFGPGEDLGLVKRLNLSRAGQSASRSGRGSKAASVVGLGPVEGDLEMKLAKVVVERWVEGANREWDDGKLLPVGYLKDDAVDSPSSHRSAKEQPLMVVLMEGTAAGLLRPGMGLVGTWVELARIGSSEKERKERRYSYWYVEDLLMAVPSFWTVESIEDIDDTL